MMKPYLRTQRQKEKASEVTGIAATVGVHVVAAAVCVFSGLSYLDPPPPERTALLISFEEEMPEVRPVQTRIGREPQAEETDPEREVDLVQKSASPYVNDRPNVTPASRPDPAGDVEVPAPDTEPALDQRALFPGMTQKESPTQAPVTAAESTDRMKAGQSDGNTPEGKTQGSANAHLQGRNVVGTLPRPSYSAQLAGTVVVQVKVDQYGNVTEAIPGVEGTTVTDKTLWNAARNAAMKAHFNMSADAPVLQTGTITYVFKLR